MEECLHILKTEKRGVLSVNGDNDYPYGMPMNHWYNEEDGKIYFHCGKIVCSVRFYLARRSQRFGDRISFCTNVANQIYICILDCVVDNFYIIDVRHNYPSLSAFVRSEDT